LKQGVEKRNAGKPLLSGDLSSGTNFTFSELKCHEFLVSQEVCGFHHILFALETVTEASG